MPRLKCPRCATVIDVAPGASPVCPACGFGSGSGSAPSTPVSGPVLSPPPAGGFSSPPDAWGSQPMGMPPGQQKTSGKAIAALVLGIVGCCIWIVPYLGAFLAVGCGIAALVLGVLTVKESGRDPAVKGKGMGITGIVLGSIMVLVGIFLLLALFVGIAIIDEYCADNPDNPACEDYNASEAHGPGAAPWAGLASAAARLAGPGTPAGQVAWLP